MSNVSMDLAGVYVQATKKGKPPVLVEKRPKGKVVTVISNIVPQEGGPKQLLSLLKHRLGCGGLVAQGGGGVELQGSHEEGVIQLLNQYKLLKGIAGTGKNAERKEPQPEVPMYKREDWSCYNCSTLNQGERSTCSKCSSFRKWTEQQRELDAQGVVRPTMAPIGALVKRAPHWCPVDWLYCTGYCNTEKKSEGEGEEIKTNEGCWSNWDDCICAELEVHETADSKRGKKRSFADESSYEALMNLGMIACKFVGDYDRTQKKPKTQKAKKTEQEERKTAAPKPVGPAPAASNISQFKNYTPPVVYQPAPGRPRPVHKKAGGGGGSGAEKGVKGAGLGGGGRSFRFGNARYETDDDEYYDEEEEEEQWEEDWPEPPEPVAVGWTNDAPCQPSSSSSASFSVPTPNQSEIDDMFEGYDAEEQAMIAAALGLSKQDTKEKTMLKLALRLSMEQHKREQEFREEVGEVAADLEGLSLPEQKAQTKQAPQKQKNDANGWYKDPAPKAPNNTPAPAVIHSGRTVASGARNAWGGPPAPEEFPSLSSTAPRHTPAERSRAPPPAAQFPPLAAQFPPLSSTGSRHHRRPSQEDIAKVANAVVQHEFPALPSAPRRRSSEDIFARPRPSSAIAAFPLLTSTVVKTARGGAHPTPTAKVSERSVDSELEKVLKLSLDEAKQRGQKAELEKVLQLSLEEEKKQQSKIAAQIEVDINGTTICPVEGCGKHVPLAQLNQHLDECLNMQYIHTPAFIHSNLSSSSPG